MPSRDIPGSGGFAELARDCGVTGATPDPPIVANAIISSDLYDSLGGCTISTLKRARRKGNLPLTGVYSTRSGHALSGESAPDRARILPFGSTSPAVTAATTKIRDEHRNAVV